MACPNDICFSVHRNTNPRTVDVLVDSSALSENQMITLWSSDVFLLCLEENETTSVPLNRVMITAPDHQSKDCNIKITTNAINFINKIITLYTKVVRIELIVGLQHNMCVLKIKQSFPLTSIDRNNAATISDAQFEGLLPEIRSAFAQRLSLLEHRNDELQDRLNLAESLVESVHDVDNTSSILPESSISQAGIERPLVWSSLAQSVKSEPPPAYSQISKTKRSRKSKSLKH